MKNFLIFIRTTITGGILFLLPIVILIIILEKAYAILSVLARPISSRLNAEFLGMNGSILITIGLIIIICFVSGLFFRSDTAKRWVKTLEERLLVNIPGYALLKSITADTVGERSESSMSPVMIQDGESWSLGFLCEEGKQHTTVFIPDAPSYDAGEIRVVPSGDVKKLEMTANQFAKTIKGYGKGVLKHVE